jgi:hypothetical protein
MKLFGTSAASASILALLFTFQSTKVLASPAVELQKVTDKLEEGYEATRYSGSVPQPADGSRRADADIGADAYQSMADLHGAKDGTQPKAVAGIRTTSQDRISSNVKGGYPSDFGVIPHHFQPQTKAFIKRLTGQGPGHRTGCACAEIQVADDYFKSKPKARYVPGSFLAHGIHANEDPATATSHHLEPCGGAIGGTGFGCSQFVNMVKDVNQQLTEEEVAACRSQDEVDEDGWTTKATKEGQQFENQEKAKARAASRSRSRGGSANRGQDRASGSNTPGGSNTESTRGRSKPSRGRAGPGQGRGTQPDPKTRRSLDSLLRRNPELMAYLTRRYAMDLTEELYGVA